ncbi:uncharacterized protein LOC116352137 [Contarinia nasturtii]|uniref:uncharacterized protein LOC116352137 n=1 Tax=Contarinia nasturtii TaxID=265458 RepID=UPI0012D37997|nr:uncharacterized protein LOC116352137 [Contarinia nasturtii]
MSSTDNSITSKDLQDNNGSKTDTADSKVIRVGSRKSELALVQTRHVISLLKSLYPQQKFEIHKMTTVGDRVLNISLPKIGEKSLFTKDLEDALKNGTVDFVVHSLKDLPTALPDGMAIGAVLKREDARDALVLAKQHAGKCLKTLPQGSIIGTSSLRRTAQISRLYPHLKVEDIRGNLNTRLAKLDAEDSKYAGIILAQAGLVRLNWEHRITQTIEPSELLYAVGQGALAVECRSSDTKILAMLQKLVCHETQCRILAERSFLKTLGGGCSAPVAVDSILSKRKHINDTEIRSDNEYELRIIGSVWSLNGKTQIQAETSCNLNINTQKESEEVEEDVVPTKKMKLSINVGDDNNELSGDNPSPPQIVDHSQINFNASNLSDSNHNLDIAGLLNVHNDAFKKCPYSSLVQNKTDKQNQNTDSSGEPLKCPLDFSIGQDVMGQCPYFDSIESLTKTSSSCGSCPYKSGCASKNDAPSKEHCTNTNVDIKKCPFLSATPSSSQTTTSTIDNLSNENEINEQLFCGLYPHRYWPLDVFEKCEQLGKDLASNLIEKGALTVMECAQNEIRKKA